MPVVSSQISLLRIAYLYTTNGMVSYRALSELGQKMAQAPARRRSPRSRTLMLAFASAPCPLLPLGPARRNLHRGDASLSTRAPGTHPRSPSPALLSAARSSPASCRGSLASVQSNGLEAAAENRVYSAQATEEPLAH